ncbi:hypothetical protein J2Z60_000173 [Lactobacillus colini]|uniref:Phage protein n=1 Tax=Lactobacillus colini TaxID=1819254 RepID=A0ABS4MBI0_9LACO|nr:hypothetical protein [Lactobacillus colini]MBP2057011.1 hypothetical protein [Lactobacillus colini]
MSDIKFTLNRSGVRELLKGSAMQNMLTKMGNDVASRAGSDYKAVTSVKGTRAINTIMPDSVQAHYKNLKHNTLLKALGGGN